MSKHFKLLNSKVCTAVLAAVTSTNLFAADADPLMEEVVATASRLQGSAAAVIQERKQQAFVADLLGSEQISRTGDSDAASALKRVTGLTLVGGKFIYVRGLGERYSSTTLNGANVPSPDPTRKVVPLDMFPSGIIENLSVQKAYSPSMAGEFGGGAIDIRTKSIPSEFVFTINGSLGYNSENSDDGLTYDNGSSFWGDVGERELPSIVKQNIDEYGVINKSILTSTLGDAELADQIVDQTILAFDNSNNVTRESIDPDYGFGFSVGNRFELTEDVVFGVLLSSEYDNSWSNAKERKVRFDTTVDGINAIEDKEVLSTEHEVQISTILNFGLEFGTNHRIETTSIFLRNSRDKVELEQGEDFDYDASADVYNILFEKRELTTNQIRGIHNFPDLMNLGFDWQFTKAKATRDAPDEREIVYIPLQGQAALATDSKTPALSRFFSELEDEAEIFQWNASLPIYLDNTEIELKVGADHSKKWRTSNGVFFQYLSKYSPAAEGESNYLVGDIDSVYTDEILTSNLTQFQQLLRVDDYIAARMLDSYYGQFDVFFDQQYRLSGGVRFEDWRQAVVPIGFENNRKKALEPTAIAENELLPALSFTYIMSDEQQVRLGYGKTLVRPDLKELSPVRYLDPLTDNPVFGNPDLKVTEIQNFDIRWEYYSDTSDTLSVALFYKDLTAPIENIQLPGADESNVSFINADRGEIYGTEFEWMKSLDFIGKGFDRFFFSGNITLSDSEIVIPDQYSYFSLANQALLPITSDDNAYVTNPTRRMTGHSEYVVNLQLGFDSYDGEHSASLVYNRFGERIMSAGIDRMPDLIESPFDSFDIVYTYYPTFETKMSLKVKNILGDSQEFTRNGEVAESSDSGQEVSLSFSWEL
ncbi:TonB-dependent receptor [Catenovulum sp. 2E275]|uniref:TonB-dependent receptor domain-containing protein n=1 Tax=Catenovulum sp. 2E275 TaxID=2980497 RepID=UPI0021D2B778|nr:TonB-dependent receptor [Catenovulum sp. 2E275]MCU4674314.1 TonB-dependent receptor [Catenovulum sp. 2E275]